MSNEVSISLNLTSVIELCKFDKVVNLKFQKNLIPYSQEKRAEFLEQTEHTLPEERKEPFIPIRQTKLIMAGGENNDSLSFGTRCSLCPKSAVP